MGRLKLIGLVVLAPLVVGVAVVLALTLSRQTVTPERPGGSRDQEDPLRQARTDLAATTDLNTCQAALQLVNNHLTAHPEDRPPSWAEGERAAVQRLLALSDADLAEADSASYTLLDGQHLDACFLFGDVARLLDVPGAGGAEPVPVSGLERARRAFAFCVRQVRLKDHAEVRVWDRPDAPQTEHPARWVTPPAYTLRRGWGTPTERALVFLELLRQVGAPGELTGCLVCDADGKRVLWAGVVVGDGPDLYLFDPEAGLALPGAAGVGTLAEVRTDGPANPLRQLDVSDSERYPVSVKQAQATTVKQVIPLSAVAPRTRTLQGRLLPPVQVRAAVDARREQERLTAAARHAAGASAEVLPWMDVDLENRSASGATLLRRFLPTGEGGTDTARHFFFGGVQLQLTLRQLYEFELAPWSALPPPFNNWAVFPPNVGLGQRVLSRFGGYWIEPVTDPEKWRNFELRGRFRKALEQLVVEANTFEGRLEREKEEKDLPQRVRDWANNVAKPVYAHKAAAQEALQRGRGNAEDLAEAAREEAALWEDAGALPVRILLDAGVARARLPELIYQRGLCLQEQAERLQARVEAAAEPDERDVEECQAAWRDALSLWKRYLSEYTNGMDRTGARRMQARAQLLCGQPASAAARRREALKVLDNLADAGTLPEKIALTCEARRLRAAAPWWEPAPGP